MTDNSELQAFPPLVAPLCSLAPGQLCAGPGRAAAAACQGDSGGPLVAGR